MNKLNSESVIGSGRYTVVDVRTRAEFMGGHVAGSVNLPLDEITSHIETLRELPQPLVLCCASGGRSAQAFVVLSGLGIECVNGGSWLDVNYLCNKTA